MSIGKLKQIRDYMEAQKATKFVDNEDSITEHSNNVIKLMFIQLSQILLGADSKSWNVHNTNTTSLIASIEGDNLVLTATLLKGSWFGIVFGKDGVKQMIGADIIFFNAILVTYTTKSLPVTTD